MTKRIVTVGPGLDFIYDDDVYPNGVVSETAISSGAAPVEGSEVVRLDDIGSGGIAAPIDAEYVVMTVTGDLTDERALAVGSSLTLSDGGAGSNVTLNTIQDLRTIDTPTFNKLILNTGTGITAIEASGPAGGNIYDMYSVTHISTTYPAVIDMLCSFRESDSTPHVGCSVAIGKEQSWTSTVSTQDAYYAIGLIKDGSLSEKFRINSGGSVNISGNYLLNDTQYTGIFGNERIEFYTAGYVAVMGANFGIGTALPQRTVHIESSFACLRISDSNAANDQEVNTLIEFYRGNNTNRVGYLAMDSTTNDIMALATDYAAGILQFRTGSGVAAMTINASQNVGIGTSTINANYKLIVRRAADVNFGIGLQSSELALAAFNDAISANIPMRFYASEFNFINGNFGIGTDMPDNGMHLKRSAADAIFKIENTGNGNYSQLNFSRERSTGEDVVGVEMSLVSDTSGTPTTFDIDVNTATGAHAFAGGGIRFFGSASIASYVALRANNAEILRAIDGNVGISDASPTVLLSANGKAGMSSIGGHLVRLTNKTGGNSVAGEPR